MSTTPFQSALAATRREQFLIARSRGYSGPVSELPEKLASIVASIRVFEGARLAYALIGGLAVGIRSGVPRATLDVDFAVSSGADRATLVSLFCDAGFHVVGEFAHSIDFKHGSGEPVQLAFDPRFDIMIERADRIDVGDLAIRVVTTADLIAMKRRVAADPARCRSKALRDQADIALLEGDVPDAVEGW